MLGYYRMKPNNPNAGKTAMFECKICDFTSSKESNYNIHLTTSKHTNDKNIQLDIGFHKDVYLNL